MSYLVNFPFEKITLVSTLVLTHEQLRNFQDRIDTIHEKGSFLGEHDLQQLDNGLIQIIGKNGLDYKIDGVFHDAKDLISPILTDGQYCRTVTLYLQDTLELKIEDICFDNKGLIVPSTHGDIYANIETPISDINDVSEIPEAKQLKILELSGLHWSRLSTVVEYLSSTRFKITEENANKLQILINKYNWGEYDNPVVDFNNESNTAFISGVSADHGVLEFENDELDDDEELDENIEIADLISQFAEPNQQIKYLAVSQFKYTSYVVENLIEI